MKKITVKDLENWMDENGEQPIIDGPYCRVLDEDFYSLFRSKLSPKLLAALVEYHELESVDELKHYAKDAGKSQAAIDSIQTPVTTYAFIADGVLIKE